MSEIVSDDRAVSPAPRTAGRSSVDPFDPSRLGPTLTLWVILTVFLQGAFWLSGWKSLVLAEAVEHGAAISESRTFGEVHEETIRRSIRTQRDTLPFWTAMSLIGDFVLDPMALCLRAVSVATIFCAIAALSGRRVQFGPTLVASVAIQGVWVLGLLIRLMIMVVLRNPDVETSVTVLLPPGTYRAPLWVALRQIDPFPILGWYLLARNGWRLGQVNRATALLTCGALWALESVSRIVWTLTIESGTRLMLIPEWLTK
jgi:hypothetical protein